MKLTTQVCLPNKIPLANYKDTLSQVVPDDIPTLSISNSDIEEELSEEEDNSEAEEGSFEGEDHFDEENLVDKNKNNSSDE